MAEAAENVEAAVTNPDGGDSTAAGGGDSTAAGGGGSTTAGGGSTAASADGGEPSVVRADSTAPSDTDGGETTADGSGGDTTPEGGGGWNGELDSLHAAEWFKKIPEDLRDVVTEGIRSKYAAFHRDYTRKTQELARARQELESQKAQHRAELEKRASDLDARERELQALEEAANLLLWGDEDPQEGVKQLIENAVQAEREAQLAEQAKLREQIEALQAARDELQAKWQEHEAAEAARQEQEEEEAAELMEAWIRENAPDLLPKSEDDDTTPLDLLLTNIIAGVSPEDALTMVRSKYPAPTAKAERVPPSVDLMHRGDGGTGVQRAQPEKSYHELIDELERQAALKLT